jgi:hypothetical protein
VSEERIRIPSRPLSAEKVSGRGKGKEKEKVSGTFMGKEKVSGTNGTYLSFFG